MDGLVIFPKSGNNTVEALDFAHLRALLSPTVFLEKIVAKLYS